MKILRRLSLMLHISIRNCIIKWWIITTTTNGTAFPQREWTKKRYSSLKWDLCFFLCFVCFKNSMEYKSFLLIDSHNQQTKKQKSIRVTVCLSKKNIKKWRTETSRKKNYEWIGKMLLEDWIGGRIGEGVEANICWHTSTQGRQQRERNKYTHTQIDNINANLNIVFYRWMSKEQQGVAQLNINI